MKRTWRTRIEWTCPVCDTPNEDDAITTDTPVCAGCGEPFEWFVILEDQKTEVYDGDDNPDAVRLYPED